MSSNVYRSSKIAVGTANGTVETDLRSVPYNEDLECALDSLLMPDCPDAAALGELIKSGFDFQWLHTAFETPQLWRPDGSEVELRVDDNVPVTGKKTGDNPNIGLTATVKDKSVDPDTASPEAVAT